jgi:hypothetical protein
MHGQSYNGPNGERLPPLGVPLQIFQLENCEFEAVQCVVLEIAVVRPWLDGAHLMPMLGLWLWWGVDRASVLVCTHTRLFVL